MTSNGWIIDTTPYHETHAPAFARSGGFHNSDNKHTFCQAKFYKQAFHCIPRLTAYDAVVWLDGTVEITSPQTAQIVLARLAAGHPIATWQHEHRTVGGDAMAEETRDSAIDRYKSTFWFGQPQPFQDCPAQLAAYRAEGFDRTVFPRGISMWITCFVAFDRRWPGLDAFLDTWYLQTLQYTTQDQIGFPYTCWKTGTVPYTFPDEEVNGAGHSVTDLYKKHEHAC